MKVAIISDIHENYHNLFQALERIETQNVERILCLGDLVSPNVAMMLAASKIPVHSVWGNNDGDKVGIVKKSLHSKSRLTMADRMYDQLEVEGRKIFLVHYNDTARQMAESGHYDAVFYGHTHKKSRELVGDCLLVNPGEISALRTGIASYAVYDTVENEVEFFCVEGCVSTKKQEDRKKFEEAKNKFA